MDGGKTFRTMGGEGHGDHHALVIDPRNSNHLLIGNDGGLDISYDQGDTWEDITTMAVGQFYAVSADMRKPYYVCGGLQDNGSWCGPSAVRSGQILNTDWYRIGGGDGFYTQNDPADWTIGYVESQDGSTSRYDLRTGRSQSIRPRPPQAPPERRGLRHAAAQQAGGRGGGQAATSFRRHRRTRCTGSIGTLRSCSLRRTRALSTWEATGCSSPWTGVPPTRLPRI